MRGAGEREKQVVKRNETRGSDHISADMRAMLLGQENAERAQSRLAAVCDVCGYGFYCPAAGTEMSGVVRGAADGTAESATDVTRGYDERECSVGDVLRVWEKLHGRAAGARERGVPEGGGSRATAQVRVLRGVRARGLRGSYRSRSCTATSSSTVGTGAAAET